MTWNLENDLKECLKLIDPNWKMQNNFNDRRSNFIYDCDTLEECLNEITRTGVDRNYALHRWYNFKTSTACEDIFCEFGAVPEEDKRNHDVDIYIDGIPFDVKLTIYPAKLSHRPYNLKTRSGKNQMIEWYYANQSQQGRKQMLNRLYVVCDGATQEESLRMKSDFSILREKINAFMGYALNRGINQIQITDDGRVYTLYSDVIYITYN